MLTALDNEHATLLLRDGLSRVSLGTLAAVWRGSFGTYWLAPTGYQGAMERGQRGPSVDWLWTQVSRAQDATPPEAGTPFVICAKVKPASVLR